MRPQKPIPKPKQQIDLKDAETMTCQKCENKILNCLTFWAHDHTFKKFIFVF